MGRLEKGGSITVEKDARLENMPGATLHLMDASVLQTSVTATHALLHNAGWIRKSIGTNEARILGAFANDGRVTVESGALSVESTGVHTGTFEMEAGTSLIFRQASLPALNEFTISSGIRGSAPVIFTRRDAGSTRPLIGIIRGELNVARLVVSNSKLFLSGGRTLPALEVGGPAGSGILELDGDLGVTGELLLQGATLQPASSTSALTVRNGGVGRVINLTLPAGVTMLNQAGAQLDLSTSVRIESQALLHNQSGGTFTLISTNAQLSTGSIDSSSIQPGAFWNEGAFATATNGVHGLALNITNAGLMEIRSGAVEVSQGQLFQMGGELRLAGGELKLRRNTFTDRPPLVLRGGELTGHGSVGFSSTGGNVTITNLGCTIKPGLPLGVLNSLQRLTLQSGSVLEIELGGLTPGTEHDQLVVAEVLRMGGVLRLRLRDGYVPSVGDEFTVITFDSSSSTTFATIEGQNIGGGKRLEVFYQSSRVLVRCVAAP